MVSQRICEGDFVVISPINQETGLESYTSRVETVDNATVLIHSPFFCFDYARLPITEMYWINLKKSAIRYKAAILNYLSKNKDHFLQFKLLDEGEKIQRREFFRLSCQIPTEFKPLKKNNFCRQKPSEPHHEGLICNLSAGGLKLMTNLKMEEKDSILIPFSLGGDDFRLTGEIRTKYGKSAVSKQFQYGVIFDDISEKDQDKISKHLLHQQYQRVRPEFDDGELQL